MKTQALCMSHRLRRCIWVTVSNKRGAVYESMTQSHRCVTHERRLVHVFDMEKRGALYESLTHKNVTLYMRCVWVTCVSSLTVSFIYPLSSWNTYSASFSHVNCRGSIYIRHVCTITVSVFHFSFASVTHVQCVVFTRKLYCKCVCETRVYHHYQCLSFPLCLCDTRTVRRFDMCIISYVCISHREGARQSKNKRHSQW